MKIIYRQRHIIISILLFILIRFLVPVNEVMLERDVISLGLFVSTVYLWITVAVDWPSLLSLAMFIIFGLYSPNEIYQISFGNTTVPMVISCLALNEILISTKVMDNITSWLVTRKVVVGRPYVFIGSFLLTALVFSLILENATFTLVFLSLSRRLCKNIGVEKGESFYSVMTACVMWTAAVGGGATPICHAFPVILLGTMKNTGLDISYVEYMRIGVPYAIIGTIIAFLIMRFIWRPDVSKFMNYDVEKMRATREPMTKQGKVSLFFFIVVIILWVVPELLYGILPTFSSYMNGLGTTVVPIVAISLLCIIHVDDKPIVDFKEIMPKIPVWILIYTAGVCAIGSVIGSSNGISASLKNILYSAVDGLGPIAIMGILIILALIMTNLMSNLVTMLLMSTIGFSLIPAELINPAIIVGISGVIGFTAVLLPSASLPAALCYAEGDLDVKKVMPYNIILLVLCGIAAFGLVNIFK